MSTASKSKLEREEEEKKQVEDMILDYASKCGMVSVLREFVREKGLHCFKKTDLSQIRLLLAVVLVIVSNDDVKQFSKAVRFLKVISEKLVQNSTKPIQPHRCAKIIITLKKRILFNKIAGYKDSAEVLALINKYFADTETNEPISTSLYQKIRLKLLEAYENGNITHHKVGEEEMEKTLERLKQYMTEVNRELPKTKLEELSFHSMSDYEAVLEENQAVPGGYCSRLIMLTMKGQLCDSELKPLLQDMWGTESRGDESSADEMGDTERWGGDERTPMGQEGCVVKAENGGLGSSEEEGDDSPLGNDAQKDNSQVEEQQQEEERTDEEENCPDNDQNNEAENLDETENSLSEKAKEMENPDEMDKIPSDKGSDGETQAEECSTESPLVRQETEFFQDEEEDSPVDECKAAISELIEETISKIDDVDVNDGSHGNQIDRDDERRDEEGVSEKSPNVENANSTVKDMSNEEDGNQSETLMDTESDDSPLMAVDLHPPKDADETEEANDEPEDHEMEDVEAEEQTPETRKKKRRSSSDSTKDAEGLSPSNSDAESSTEKQDRKRSKRRRTSPRESVENEPVIDDSTNETKKPLKPRKGRTSSRNNAENEPDVSDQNESDSENETRKLRKPRKSRRSSRNNAENEPVVSDQNESDSENETRQLRKPRKGRTSSRNNVENEPVVSDQNESESENETQKPQKPRKARRTSSRNNVENEPVVSDQNESDSESETQKPKKPRKRHSKYHQLYVSGLRTIFKKQRNVGRVQRSINRTKSERRAVRTSRRTRREVDYDKGIEVRECFVVLTRLEMGTKTRRQVLGESVECRKCSVELTKYKVHPTVRGQICFPYIGLLTIKPSLPGSGIYT